jgi:hypothetical protein
MCVQSTLYPVQNQPVAINVEQNRYSAKGRPVDVTG